MVTAKSDKNVGRIILPESEIDAARVTKNGNTPLWLHNGEYEMLAYSGVPDLAGDETFNFYEANEIDPDSIKLTYKLYQNVDRTDILNNYKDWIDSNPYSGFIVTGVMPLYIAKTKINVPVTKNNNTHVECKFKPIIKSQKVNVQFNIAKKEAGIIIDSIHAEMSGIGAEIVIGSGAISTEPTGKVLFTPTYSATESNGPIAVKGSFYATGIVRSASQSRRLGPGIMQLNIHARTAETMKRMDWETGKEIEYTIMYKKVYKVSINLYKTLGDTPSLIYDESVNGFVQSAPEITLHIGSMLEITRDGILSNKIDKDEWVDNGVSVVVDI